MVDHAVFVAAGQEGNMTDWPPELKLLDSLLGKTNANVVCGKPPGTLVIDSGTWGSTDAKAEVVTQGRGIPDPDGRTFTQDLTVTPTWLCPNSGFCPKARRSAQKRSLLGTRLVPADIELAGGVLYSRYSCTRKETDDGRNTPGNMSFLQPANKAVGKRRTSVLRFGRTCL